MPRPRPYKAEGATECRGELGQRSRKLGEGRLPSPTGAGSRGGIGRLGASPHGGRNLGASERELESWDVREQRREGAGVPRSHGRGSEESPGTCTQPHGCNAPPSICDLCACTSHARKPYPTQAEAMLGVDQNKTGTVVEDSAVEEQSWGARELESVRSYAGASRRDSWQAWSWSHPWSRVYGWEFSETGVLEQRMNPAAPKGVGTFARREETGPAERELGSHQRAVRQPRRRSQPDGGDARSLDLGPRGSGALESSWGEQDGAERTESPLEQLGRSWLMRPRGSRQPLLGLRSDGHGGLYLGTELGGRDRGWCLPILPGRTTEILDLGPALLLGREDVGQDV